MADLHEVVVDHVSEVVGRESVILQDDLVVDVLIVEHDLAVDDVAELSLALGDLHADDERLTVRLLLLDLVLAPVVHAEAVVLGLRVLLPADLNPHLLQPLRRAEARVGVPVLQQRVDELVVDRQSLALEVRTVGSESLVSLDLAFVFGLEARAWALVPRQARPLQHVHDVLGRARLWCGGCGRRWLRR